MRFFNNKQRVYKIERKKNDDGLLRDSQSKCELQVATKLEHYSRKLSSSTSKVTAL